MVVANNTSNTVSVFINTGSGTFAAASNYLTQANPVSVAIGDVNGDGKADLATSSNTSVNVSVLLNSGTGTFGAATNYALSAACASIAMGDVNSDGKLDLVATNNSSNNISVLLNSGTGTFGTALTYATGSNPQTVAVGDVNGDGKVDLAVANAGSNNVSILLNGCTSATATTDYFRTRASGNWSDATTWESSTDNIAFVAASFSPDFNANTITIQSPHVVTISVNLTIDQTTINSGGSVIVNPNTVLTLNDGTGTDLTIASGGNLTIKSTSAGTGSIGNSTTASISGEATVERYISSSGNRDYRLLTPSVNTGSAKPFIKNNWQEGTNNPNTSTNNNPVPNYGTHITGSQVGANGFDATPSGQGSLFTYDQASNAYVPATNTDATNMLAKTGYLIYIRGDRTATNITAAVTSSNTTLRATGSLLTGTVQFTGLAINSGFSLVTNPYASAINWSTIRNNNTASFTDYYTYLDPNIGSGRGGYVTVSNTGFPAPGPPNNQGINIQSGLAFFVSTRTGIMAPPTLTIQESDKSTTNNVDVFRTAAAAQTFTASLYFNSATQGRRIADGVAALFDNTYNAAIDGNDAVEIANFDENIAFNRTGTHLSIEERPTVTKTDSLPLFMSNMKQQAYELDFNPTGFASNMVAKLVDKFTGTDTYLNISTPTTVPFTITADAASSAADRFMVVFSPSVALPVTLSSVKAYQKNTGVQVEWITQTESNMDRYEVERSQNGQSFNKIGTVAAKGNSSIINNYNLFDAAPNNGVNFYRIRSVDKNGQATNSAIVKVNISSNVQTQLITVSPNPVEGNSVTVQFTNLTAGTYTISLSNKLGQQIASKVVQHPGGSATETLEAQVLATGLYQLKITGGGSVITKQVIKK